MTIDLSLRDPALSEADERGSVPGMWAEALADIVGETIWPMAKCSKVRKSALDQGRSQGSKGSAKTAGEQLAPATVQDGNPTSLTMSGEDCYRAACSEAHARLVNLR
jgi:hypothetical protein